MVVYYPCHDAAENGDQDYKRGGEQQTPELFCPPHHITFYLAHTQRLTDITQIKYIQLCLHISASLSIRWNYDIFLCKHLQPKVPLVAVRYSAELAWSSFKKHMCWVELITAALVQISHTEIHTPNTHTHSYIQTHLMPYPVFELLLTSYIKLVWPLNCQRSGLTQH